MRFLIATLLVTSFVFSPVSAHADYDTSDAYRAMSTEEKIAYLLGMVAQLQMILVTLEAEEGRLSSGDSDVSVRTFVARDIEEDEAELRGEVDLQGEDEARVWFEYGEDDDDLDERTSRRRITDARGDEQTFSATVRDLDDDERYYYRAIAADESGDRVYGRIRSFETDRDRDWFDDRDDDDDDRDGVVLDLDDDEFDRGDRITIEWSVADGEENARNWIGLYLPDASNRNFIEWKYLPNDEDGEISFIVDDRGTYEFRLFYNDSYFLEGRSEEFDVD